MIGGQHMLDLNKKYSTTEIENLKDFITVAYVIIDEIYHVVAPTHVRERRNIKASKMSDSEIITISVVGELLTINSEKAWFNFCKKNFKDLFPRFCDRSRFNRTRRALFKIIELIHKKLSQLLGYYDSTVRVVDSMPLPVCHFGRATFHKTYRGYVNYGRCPSKKETYYGFKLHLLITLDGYITDFCPTSADIDDRAALWDLVESYHSITILGDKGYIDNRLASELKAEKGITLLPLKRNNSKSQYPKQLRRAIFRLRRRIETTGSQLSCQLNIQRVLARSVWGLITRIKTKILGHGLCYYVNKVFNSEPKASQIKGLIFG